MSTEQNPSGAAAPTSLFRCRAADGPPPAHTVQPPAPALSLALRVLIVDDNRDLADALSALLELKGYETRTAYDGQHALAAARDFRPDVVVLDLNMPVLDGYAAAQHLRKTRGADVFLLAMTGAAERETKEMAYASGFDLHLGKPVDCDDLVEALARIRR